MKIFACIASILAFFSFTTIDAIVKVLVQWYSPLVISTHFRIGSSFLLLPVMIFVKLFSNHHHHPFAISHPIAHLARGILFSILTVGFTHGFSVLPLNTGYAIVFLLPMVTTICSSLFLKEHISKLGVFAILGGFIGIFIVLRPGVVPFSLGYISLIIAICCEAPFFILIRRYNRNDHPLSIVFYSFTIATVFLTIATYLKGDTLTIHEFSHLILFAIGGLLNVFAQLLLVFSLSHITAPTSISMQYTQIIPGTIYGVFWFKDTFFDIFYLIGVIIIIFCSYIIVTQRIPFWKKNSFPSPS